MPLVDSGVKRPVRASATAKPTATDGRTERWRAHRVSRRRELVDAALTALAEHGPEVRMEQIAAVAGIGKPMLYRHFADKADLVDAVGQRASELLLERLTGAFDPSVSVREALRRGLDAYLGLVEDNPNTVRFLLENASPTNGRVSAILENARTIARLFVALASVDLKAADVPTDGAEPLAHALVGALLGGTDWWLLMPDESRMPRTRLVEHLSVTLLGAIDATLRAAGLVLDADAPVNAAHISHLAGRND